MAVFSEKYYSYQQIEKLNAAAESIQQKVFEECFFTQCDFSGCDFSKTRFVDCFFTDCNLSNLRIANTAFQKVSFRECKMMGLDFSRTEAFLFEVKFESCVLDYVSFMGKKMADTHFVDCSLKQAVFIETDLKKAVFREVDLDGAVFEDSNLMGADLVGAKHYVINPTKNNIQKASFSLDGIPGLLSEFKLNIV